MSEKPIDFDLIQNAGYPQGALGVELMTRMNSEHASLTAWGWEKIRFGSRILDVGCGGGGALARLAAMNPDAKLFGCDISPCAVTLAQEVNREFIEAGRVKIREGSVSPLPYPDASVETVYSIESLYFWPDPLAGLREIRRVLAPQGSAMAALEMIGGAMTPRHAEIAERLQMFCPTPDELKNLFVQAGFASVEIFHEKEHGWLCGVGIK